MNISVAGTGYVGMSLAVLLAQKHRVTAVYTSGRDVLWTTCWEECKRNSLFVIRENMRNSTTPILNPSFPQKNKF